MAVQKAVPVIPAEVVSTNPAPEKVPAAIPGPRSLPQANSAAQGALAKRNAVVNSQQAPDTSKTDSISGVKEGGTPVARGPRGVNAPRDVKPAPAKKADQARLTVTDTKDAAGNEKGVGAPHGIRGKHTSRDTYGL